MAGRRGADLVRRSHLVRFCGSYRPRLLGDVQPGVGSPTAFVTLSEDCISVV